MCITWLKSVWCSQAPRTQPPQEEEEDAEEEETEELGHVDTYAEYKPSKCRPLDWMSTYLLIYLHFSYLYDKIPPFLKLFCFLLSSATIGISHPDIVVETNTLSSVPPPDITYTLSIPEQTINSGLLSALQLEAIIYACQVHTQAHIHREFEALIHIWVMNNYCVDYVDISVNVFSLSHNLFLSNTRLSFRTTRGQVSWSEMGQGSEKDALWRESSWRITLREGRKHYGNRDLILLQIS